MMMHARPPFVWSPRQPFAANPLLAIRTATVRDDGKNRWFLFRETINLDELPATAVTNITVDGRYLLYVNGVETGRGPVRSSPLFQRYDTYDLAPYLVRGKNVVAVLVHTYGLDTAFHEQVRGLWHPVFGEGGLWVEGPVVDTRRNWRCLQSNAWDECAPQANHSLGFIESFDSNILPSNWTDVGFNDADWDETRPLLAGGGGPESMYQGLVIRPFPTLLPRSIPMLAERFVTAKGVRWIKAQKPQPDLPFYIRLYEEALTAPPPGSAYGIESLLIDEPVDATVTTPDGVDIAFTLDFGRILSGYPSFEIEAKGGEVIEIGCAERLPQEWFGAVSPDARIARLPYLGTDAHLCRYVARPGVQRFQRFEWCAIRYMHVVVRNAPDTLTIRQLGAVETHYPVEERGRFTCSDPMLTALWAAGAYTLRQCMHDAWEDCPSREQRQWLGDVTVANLAAHAAFGSSASALTAKYLLQAAESQRSDGLTQMFAPGDHGHDARLIPDWTLQWILCAGDHWQLTGDMKTIETIWPSVEKALAWFVRLSDADGVVADLPYWHFMDWAGLGREGQALPFNAQLAGAFKMAAVLGRALGYDRVAAHYEARAFSIANRLDAGHWDDIRGSWVDMVDPVTGEQKRRISQHGVAGLALWCSPQDQRLSRGFDWITDPKRVTATPAPPIVPTGTALDEENGAVMANTFYSHFVGEALALHGRRLTALNQIRTRFGPMIEAGSTTLWEAMTPWASLCHAFSASPTWFLSRHVLGVAPATPGFERISVTPDLLDLDYAEGTVPAGEKNLVVSLTRTEIGFDMVLLGGGDACDVSAPRGLSLASVRYEADRIEASFIRNQGE